MIACNLHAVLHLSYHKPISLKVLTDKSIKIDSVNLCYIYLARYPSLASPESLYLVP